MCWGEAIEEKRPVQVVPKSERSCTDVLFLLVFIAHWVVIVALFFTAVEKGGNPDRLIHGIDYEGRVCGRGAGVEDKPFAAWPAPSTSAFKFRTCLASCAETSTSENMTVTYSSARFIYACIPFPVFNGTINLKIELSGDFQSAQENLSRAIADLYTTWALLLASAFAALFLSFVYTWVLEKAAGIITFLGILFIIAAGFLIGKVTIDKAKEYGDTEVDDRAKLMNGFGWACIAATVLFLIVVIAMRKRIYIAVAVVKDAAHALSDMRQLVVFPLLPGFFGICFMVWWVAIALWLVTVWELKNSPIPDDVKDYLGLGLYKNSYYASLATYVEPVFNSELRNAVAAHFFHLLWVVQFLIYWTYLVAAGAIADWYFSRWEGDPEDRVKRRGDAPDELSNSPILDSMGRAWKHLGTVALASLIIAIVQFIRATIKYIEEKSKGPNGEQNFVQRCFFRCLHCCLWCVECCLDKINKNCLIWVSIWGDSFAPAACSSFQLIWRNLARVAAITAVSAYLMVVGKVVVGLTTVAAAAWVLDNNSKYQTEVSNIVLPCLVVFVIAFVVASLFMAIMETVIDVTFFCFLVDEENNKGHMYASAELQKIIGQYQQESVELMKRAYTSRNLKIPDEYDDSNQQQGKGDNTQ